MQFFMESWRGAEPVGLVAMNADRDLLLQVAQLCASGFGADMLSSTVDAFMSSDPINPNTGQVWAPGQLAVEAAKPGGMDRGLITEALITSVYNRSGDSTLTIQRYRVRSTVLEWLGPPPIPEHAEAGGLIEDTMKRIMEGTSVEQQMGQHGVSIRSERERAITDFAVVRALNRLLKGNGVVMLYATPGSERHRYLKYRMQGGLME